MNRGRIGERRMDGWDSVKEIQHTHKDIKKEVKNPSGRTNTKEKQNKERRERERERERRGRGCYSNIGRRGGG
jgi:hypothetical protein